MVDVGVQSLSNGPKYLNAVNIDVLKELLNLLWLVLIVHLGNERSKELNELWVVVVDTEVQAVKESEFVLLNVVRVLTDNLDDFSVQHLLLAAQFLPQSVSLLESIGDFVVEIDFLSELLKVVFLNLVVHLFFDVFFNSHNFDVFLQIVYNPVIVQVVVFGVSFLKWSLYHFNFVHFCILVVYSVLHR